MSCQNVVTHSSGKDFRSLALKSIKEHEGLRLKAYKDTRGFLTVGYGFNLDANEITEEVANLLLEKELALAIIDAKSFCGRNWEILNSVRKSVIVDMAYNLGRAGLFSLITLRTGIYREDYIYCASRMESFLWCSQVKSRCVTLVRRMRTGEF